MFWTGFGYTSGLVTRILAKVALRNRLRLFAPAKVNLGLEIIRRRPDSYHDVVTILESISIYDVIDIEPAPSLEVSAPDGIGEDDNLIRTALELMQQRLGISLGMAVSIRKSIPVAAGLGGGSSDAGTILNAVQRLFALDSTTIAEVASSIGSDVPFFLRAGTSLATGTGTTLQPIAAVGRRWYVVTVPDIVIPRKTAQLYSELNASDFGTGERTMGIATTLSQRGTLDQSSIDNAFARALLRRPAYREAHERLRAAGAVNVIPSGAGPALLTMCRSYDEAAKLASRLDPHRGAIFIATTVCPDPNAARIERLRQH